jgi:hypothetical protein
MADYDWRADNCAILLEAWIRETAELGERDARWLFAMLYDSKSKSVTHDYDDGSARDWYDAALLFFQGRGPSPDPPGCTYLVDALELLAKHKLGVEP